VFGQGNWANRPSDPWARAFTSTARAKSKTKQNAGVGLQPVTSPKAILKRTRSSYL